MIVTKFITIKITKNPVKKDNVIFDSFHELQTILEIFFTVRIDY